MVAKSRYFDLTCGQLTLEYVELVGKGGLGIYWERFKPRRRLLPKERLEFEQAKQRGYLIIREPFNERLRGLWFRWCEIADRPCVRIERYRRYSEVTIDLLGQGWRLDASALASVWGLFRELNLAGVLDRGTLGAYGDDWVHFRAVRNAWASPLAKELARLALQCKPASS